MTRLSPLLSIALLPTLILADGCSGQERLTQLADDLARQQAAQQEQLIEENRRLAESSRKLVESEAEARRELAEFQSQLQQDIQSERANVDRQREKLDDERQEIEARRHRDPLIAAALVQAATLLVAALPIVLLLSMFRAARDEPQEAAIAELLVRDLTADEPLLLPGPLCPPQRLEAPEESAPPEGEGRALPTDPQPPLSRLRPISHYPFPRRS